MNDTKRQVLPAGLWVVATPIGNLADITERAKMALAEASLIFCEDTRRTAALLSALGIPLNRRATGANVLTHEKSSYFSGENEDRNINRGREKKLDRLIRYDAHTPPRTIQSWVEKLAAGESFALVTDAGTPGISDPGALLVKLAREAGITITPLPGASAVVTLLSVAGFQGTAFQFRGFFPKKANEQKAELARAAQDSDFCRIFVWFESPFRILVTVGIIAETYPFARLTLAKELTKIHETLFSDTAPEVLSWLKLEIEREGTVGEWALAVEFPEPESKSNDSGLEKNTTGGPWETALRCLLTCEVSVSQSAQKVSHFFGIPRKICYARALELSGALKIKQDL